MNLAVKKNTVLFIIMFALLTSCNVSKEQTIKSNLRKKTIGWVSEDQFIVKAVGVTENDIDFNKKDDINLRDAKKSAIFSAHQKVLEKFRRLSANHNSLKKTKVSKIVHIIKSGTIIKLDIVSKKSCVIYYSIYYINLKKMAKESDLNDILLIN